MSLKSDWILLRKRIEVLLSILNGDYEFILRVNHIRGQGSASEMQGCLDEWGRLISDYPFEVTPQMQEVFDNLRRNIDDIDRGAQNYPISFIQTMFLVKSAYSQFDYLISQGEYEKVRLAERAFSHLQRRIIADDNYRELWQTAYHSTQGEVACEKLGGAHFLLHGVWCFKCDDTGGGGRTDLVMSEYRSEFPDDEVNRSAEALVLTEWKRSTNRLSPDRAVDAAQIQAERYGGASGVLGGVELAHLRYLVIVSQDWIGNYDDREINGIRYRIKNIAINPSLPSSESSS